MNNTLSKKVIVLGVDGMDPRLTRKYVDKGLMPNLEKYLEKGAAREDLVLLGAHPTITPPMWTTLSTGAYPVTHGITCFWSQHPTKIDTFKYANDSRNCLAEQLWDVTAEAGKKTLVWHWPGSSWPPTSDNPNLHVVDGTQPASIQMGVATVDWEKMVVASADIKEVSYKPRATSDNGAGCIITDLEDNDIEGDVLDNILDGGGESKSVRNVMLTHEDGELSLDKIPVDVVNSPVKEPTGWENAPEGAKEFTVITSSGLVRRPALILISKELSV